MSHKLSRPLILKLAGTAVVAFLGFGPIAPWEAKAVDELPEAKPALTLTDAVIDFGHNEDRVTIKCKLDGPLAGGNVGDFTVRVVIRDNRTGQDHDSGAVPPTVVR